MSSPARMTIRRAMKHRVLARVDHPHQPVERGVGVGPADALDERRDRVVVLIAGTVVEERTAL